MPATCAIPRDRFTTVLTVRHVRSDERVARPRGKIRISPQFCASDEHEEGCLPPRPSKPIPYRFRRAAFLSSLSPQPSSATSLSSLSQQPFSAAFLRSLSQQPSSAINIILLWSGVGGLLTSSCCGQGLVVYYHHLAVVRGWWSAINIILLWSGVGGLLTSSCCGHGLVVSY